jgi:serine/threonine protein kinase
VSSRGTIVQAPPPPAQALNPLAAQRNVVTVGGRIVHIPIHGLDGTYKCLLSDAGGAYMFTRDLRDAVYGKVRAYQCLRVEGGVYTRTGRLVAVKQMRWDFIETHAPSSSVRTRSEDPLMELWVMQHLQEQHGGDGHSNVQSLIEAVDDGRYLHSVMPYLGGGDLIDLLLHRASAALGPVDEPAARQLLGQLLGGLHALHDAGLAHLDLSCENVMLQHSPQAGAGVGSDAGVCSIIDFGQALRGAQRADGAVMFPQGSGRRGKINYMAPEVFDDEAEAGFDGAAADIWSLGVVGFALLVGCPPWHLMDQSGVWLPHASDARFRDIATNGVGPLLASWEAGLGAGAISFLDALLAPDPACRPTAAAALQHPWLC